MAWKKKTSLDLSLTTDGFSTVEGHHSAAGVRFSTIAPFRSIHFVTCLLLSPSCSFQLREFSIFLEINILVVLIDDEKCASDWKIRAWAHRGNRRFPTLRSHLETVREEQNAVDGEGA